MPEYIIASLINNQMYGFGMFPRNIKWQYQTIVDMGTSTATPISSILLLALPVGNEVKLNVNSSERNFIIVHHGVRPAFVLPSDLLLNPVPNDDGSYNLL